MTPTFPHWNLAHQRVFLRADLNVPTNNGKIENDFRLTKIQPTLDFLIKHHAQVILATHIGKPKNKEPELSTRILIPWFEQHGYTVRFVEEIDAIARMPIVAKEIILLENLRFFAGEKKADPLFAKQLAHTAHYYIDDAFGTIHEHDCSIAVLPYEFPENKRSIGFLIAQELQALDELKNNPRRPFVALVGGKKIEDKIPLIAHLLDKIDTLIICPALCFTFLKALHQPTGKSLFAPDMIETCKKMMLTAEHMNVDYVFPATTKLLMILSMDLWQMLTLVTFLIMQSAFQLAHNQCNSFSKLLPTHKLFFSIARWDFLKGQKHAKAPNRLSKQ